MAYKLLKQAKTGAEHRFSLKKAMMELGPEGHAFEDFVARVFQANGYQARTRQTPGKKSWWNASSTTGRALSATCKTRCTCGRGSRTWSRARNQMGNGRSRRPGLRPTRG